MLQDRMTHRVVVPADVGTGNTLKVARAALGIDVGNADLVPVLKAKTASTGLGKVLDDKVVIDTTHLVITEGATGFAAGDVFYVELQVGLPSVTAVASTV